MKINLLESGVSFLGEVAAVLAAVGEVAAVLAAGCRCPAGLAAAVCAGRFAGRLAVVRSVVRWIGVRSAFAVRFVRAFAYWAALALGSGAFSFSFSWRGRNG